MRSRSTFALGLLALVLAWPAEGQLQHAPEAVQTLETLKNSLSQMRDAQGFWQGVVEADPSADVMPLILIREMGDDLGLQPGEADRLVNESIERILQRQENGVWPAYPGGPVSMDVTGMVLLGLEKGAGVSRTDERFSRAWNRFQKAGGMAALGGLNRMISGFGGILKPNDMPRIPVGLLSFPKTSAVNVFNLGFGRSGLIPLAIWRFYKNMEAKGRHMDPLDPERVRSAGGWFGHPYPHHSAQFWAQEGLGWILDHQQADGTWAGALQISYFNLLTLHTAQKLGVGDFRDVMRKAWRGLMGWRAKIPEGTTIQQSTVGPVMDTARILTALHEAPRAFGFWNNTETESSIDWLMSQQILKPGDWIALAPKALPGGWTFEPHNDFYPDADDTAMVLEALADAEPADSTGRINVVMARGLDWLLPLQNGDGGFPTWDRDTSFLFNLAVEHHVGGAPEVSDLSQSDITSRVIMALAKIRDLAPGSPRSKRLAGPIASACEFLEGKRMKVQGESLKLWRGEWMVDYLYGTSQATQALLKSGCWTLTQAAPYIRWLVSKQEDGGGWGESPESYPQMRYVHGKPTMTQTEFVLSTLLDYMGRVGETADPATMASVEGGIGYLLGRIGNEPNPYETEFTGVYVRGVWYGRYVILPHYEGVRVLGQYLSL
ncbi:MAG TPA: prenyltransferase/squalene oxidase repeat-containing protein [Bdellovibrionota bacterium]|jgi:squalene-hopene/tetraprenyl-beta-curcumene cyclase|nr:prenyltransferase/squalene oxidase repeat-containing protein [Bdellovibrionota bacterium]